MGRWIKRIALGLGALAFLAVAAAAIFVVTFDAEDYKQDIAGAFEAATGRKVHFGGKIESNILTLQPAITLNEPALLNPPGFSRPELAKAKRVHLIVRLRPLLQRRLAIVRLEVEGADVLFETSAKGERNWREKPESPGLTPIPNPGPVPGMRIGTGQNIAGLTVDRLLLKSSRIAYLHGATKLDAEINFDEIGIVIPAADKPIDVKVAGTYQDAKIATSGQVGSLDALLNPRAGDLFPVALKVAFGKSQLELDVKADLTAKVPSAEGTITAKLLDLDQLDPAGAGTAPADGRLFSAKPLPFALLNAFDVKGQVNIEMLVLRRQRLSGVAATVALKGGDLTAAPFSFTMAGAQVQGELRVAANEAIPAVALKANGTGVQLREVTQLLFERATLSSNAAFTVNVTGRGRSLREIASGLNGPVVVALGPGPIHTSFLDFLSKDIFALHRGDALALVCALARFDFARGTGTSRRIVVDTTRATAYGSGWVSLASETLDLTFAPQTKGKSLASVAAIVPVRVHGPLRRPNATPDLSRTPDEVVKSIVGVFELPGDILGSIFGTRSGANTRNAGCGGTSSAATPNRGNDKSPGLFQRGGDILKKVNPF